MKLPDNVKTHFNYLPMNDQGTYPVQCHATIATVIDSGHSTPYNTDLCGEELNKLAKLALEDYLFTPVREDIRKIVDEAKLAPRRYSFEKLLEDLGKYLGRDL